MGSTVVLGFCAIVACVLVSAACGGKVQGEKTATLVVGTYAADEPDGGDDDSATDALDATSDSATDAK